MGSDRRWRKKIIGNNFRERERESESGGRWREQCWYGLDGNFSHMPTLTQYTCQ